MDKIKSFVKKHKKLLTCLFIFTILFVTVNTSFAKISSNSSELKSVHEAFWNNLFGEGFLADLAMSLEQFITSFSNFIINKIGQVAAGTIMKLLNVFVIAAAAVMFLLYFVFWSFFGGSAFDLPWPDKIVFNQMAMFDPNFLNYDHPDSLMDYAKNTQFIFYLEEAVKDLYFSFFIIAGAIMVIAALIIGIKLAITSISIEKAQYKEALNKWIVGMVLLFSLHFIIAGCFTINEKICEICGEVAANVRFEFDITDMNVITKAASVVKSIFNGIVGIFKGEGLDGFKDNKIKVPFQGYTGIIFYLILNATLNGDLICSITFLAVLGQTFNLIFRYIKRLFYCVFLAVLGPLVVAVDVIKKVI